MRARTVGWLLGATALVVVARAFVVTRPDPAPTCVLDAGSGSTSTRCVFAGGAGDFDGDGALDVLAIQTDERALDARAWLRIVSGRTRGTLVEFELGPATADATAVVCGDVDQDGRVDLAVGLPTDGRAETGAPPGRVAVLSGRDGRELASATGARAGDGFGARLAALDDFDGDGAPELLVSSAGFEAQRPTHAPWSSRGRVEARSGRTLAPLYVRDGEHEDARFGAALASSGDVDGDGFRDWLASALEAGDVLVVRAHSGRTGSLLYVARGTTRTLGHALASLGDCDGDGVDDFAASGGDEFDEQCVEIRSGRDGGRITSLGSPPRETFNWLERFGDVLGAPGDVDGDGCPDLFVASSTWKYEDNGHGAAGGRAWIHSGKTRETLLELCDESRFDNLGSGFAPLGDADGDGTIEFVAATRRELRVYAAR